VKLTDSDERTPTAEPMGRCPRCQRPTTLCDGHPTAEPVTPMRDDDAGCWQHGDESITTRIEPAERVIEHCTICGKDVGWTWQAAQRSTAEVERLREVEKAAETLSEDLLPYAGHYRAGIEPVQRLRRALRAALAEPDHDIVRASDGTPYRIPMENPEAAHADPMVAMANSIGGTAAEPDHDDKSGPIAAWSDDEVP
jgi:hypothetical protein